MQIWQPIDPRNFVCDVSVRPLPASPYKFWGRGRGAPRQPDADGVENAIFSWRATARCFWETGHFLAGKSHDHRRFGKRGFLKSLACLAKRFSSTEGKFGTREKNIKYL